MVAVNQLKRLGSALARHSGSEEREAVSQLFQRISLHLTRGNAALLTGRHPEADFLASTFNSSVSASSRTAGSEQASFPPDHCAQRPMGRAPGWACSLTCGTSDRRSLCAAPEKLN